LPESGIRRALLAEYESRINWDSENENHRVLRVYAQAIEEVGSPGGNIAQEAALLISRSVATAR
jgi:hypothetical protein